MQTSVGWGQVKTKLKKKSSQDRNHWVPSSNNTKYQIITTSKLLGCTTSSVSEVNKYNIMCAVYNVFSRLLSHTRSLKHVSGIYFFFIFLHCKHILERSNNIGFPVLFILTLLSPFLSPHLLQKNTHTMIVCVGES